MKASSFQRLWNWYGACVVTLMPYDGTSSKRIEIHTMKSFMSIIWEQFVYIRVK